MEAWLQWIVNVAVVTVVGLIGYFGKRTLTQIDTRQKDMESMIATGLAKLREESAEQQRASESKIVAEIGRMRQDMEGRANKTEQKVERLEERLNKSVQEMPLLYTLREDWFRSNAAIDRKLDSIIDLIVKGGRRDE